MELSSFDLIIGSNVIHTTEQLTRTLGNLKSLLRPGGQIAYAETTNPSLRWGFYDALPGWWAGVNDGRVSSALLNTEQWSQVLKESGFSGVSLEIKDYELEDDHEMSVLVSTTLPDAQPPARQEVCIVSAADTSELSDSLASIMSQHDSGPSVSQCHLLEAQSNDGVFIMLLETNGPFLTSPSKEEWEKVRDIMSHARSVLWVTRGGAVEYADPRRALVYGLARTFRSEKHELNLITLDLDPDIISSAHDAVGIYHIYNYALADS